SHGSLSKTRNPARDCEVTPRAGSREPSLVVAVNVGFTRSASAASSLRRKTMPAYLAFLQVSRGERPGTIETLEIVGHGPAVADLGDFITLPYFCSASTPSAQSAYTVQYAASGPRSRAVNRPAAASSARRSHSCRAVGLSSGRH